MPMLKVMERKVWVGFIGVLGAQWEWIVALDKQIAWTAKLAISKSNILLDTKQLFMITEL